jgi:deoxyribose-phosphate aldolase
MNDQQSNNVITPEAMAKAIDHTVLKPDAVPADLEVLANEAITNGFCAVCVNSCHVALVGEHLKGSDVRVCTVVGFPLGAMHPKAKAFEAEIAVENGASEIDMVLNVGALKSGEFKIAEKDILGVRQAVGSGKVLKVIIETCLLTDREKLLACKIAESAGADFVKTSTGFSSGGATMEDVRLMKQTVGDNMQVKASGGIKDWRTAADMLRAGATRIGTSSGVTILQDLP